MYTVQEPLVEIEGYRVTEFPFIRGYLIPQIIEPYVPPPLYDKVQFIINKVQEMKYNNTKQQLIYVTDSFVLTNLNIQ